jgi:hypothetical protein
MLASAADEKVAAAKAAAAKPGPPEKAVFEMREISVFDTKGRDPDERLTVGTYAACSTEPDKEVKAYPKLRSKHPLYGTFVFNIDTSHAGQAATKLRFVLDESGENPPDEAVQPKEDKKAAKVDGKKPAEKNEKRTLAMAKRSRYDLMYLDVNHDGDLTNDRVFRPMKSPPWHALPAWWGCDEKMAFDYLDLDVDYGPGIGVRPFRILPWLTYSGSGEHPSATMHFVPTTAHEGRIRIGSHEFDAVLSQSGMIWGRWDHPWASLRLKPTDPNDKTPYPGFSGDMMMSARQIDGTIFTTRATPLGNKLIVEPYRGEFGILALGPGGRTVKKMSFHGSLFSENLEIDLDAVSSGSADKQKKATELRLPVGDYTLSFFQVEYGSVSFTVSNNYHSDSQRMNMQRRRVYAISIRKDRPFVLDFSHKPEVMFVEPVKDRKFKPGDEVMVKAVLVDPALDLMIRRLNDTSRTKKEAYRLSNGKTESYDRPTSLDPVVTVTNSSGKKIAEGVMPFG